MMNLTEEQWIEILKPNLPIELQNQPIKIDQDALNALKKEGQYIIK